MNDDLLRPFAYLLQLITVARFLRVHAVAYFLRALKVFFEDRGKMFIIVRLISSVVSIAAFACGLIQIIESHAGKLMTFDEALYFAFTILSTVGFGDITALTIPGRYAVVLLMCVCFVSLGVNFFSRIFITYNS